MELRVDVVNPILGLNARFTKSVWDNGGVWVKGFSGSIDLSALELLWVAGITFPGCPVKGLNAELFSFAISSSLTKLLTPSLR